LRSGAWSAAAITGHALERCRRDGVAWRAIDVLSNTALEEAKAADTRRRAGMKPTFGLVPRTGVIPTWPYLDTHGPLARSVADAALLLAVIAGADLSDPLALTGSTD